MSPLVHDLTKFKTRETVSGPHNDMEAYGHIPEQPLYVSLASVGSRGINFLEDFFQ
jgi:hypothetical protein